MSKKMTDEEAIKCSQEIEDTIKILKDQIKQLRKTLTRVKRQQPRVETEEEKEKRLSYLRDYYKNNKDKINQKNLENYYAKREEISVKRKIRRDKQARSCNT